MRMCSTLFEPLLLSLFRILRLVKSHSWRCTPSPWTKPYVSDWFIKSLMPSGQTRWLDHTQPLSELGKCHCAETILKGKGVAMITHIIDCYSYDGLSLIPICLGRCAWTERASGFPSKLSNALTAHRKRQPQAETKSVFPCLVSLCEKWKTFYPMRNNTISNYMDVSWKYIRYVPWSKNKNNHQKNSVMWLVWQNY